jgi:MFS family permease
VSELHTGTTAASRVGRVDNDVLLACGLCWVTALIHLQAAVDHFDESLLYAAFFIALAATQLAWGAALYHHPRRGLLILGALASLCVVGLWILSRTVGLPLGPDSVSPETVGALDAIATADEIALTALIALQLFPPRFDTRGWAARPLRVGAVLLILLSSMVLGGGFHAH